MAGGAHHKGVMGKCTFCVQRVERGLNPACVTTCPVKALVFGDLDDSQSDVTRAVSERARFRLLEEVGTEPSVYYLSGQPPGPEDREIEHVDGEV